MADGDNQEALTQAKAKIKELEDKVAALEKELDKQKTIVDNAEKKFKEMAEETGSSRKAIADAAHELIELRKSETKAREDLEAASVLLAEAKKQGPRGGREQSPTHTEKTADEIEADLTEAEQKKLDEAWKAAPDDLKKRIRADEATRKAFLMEAKEQVQRDEADDLTDWRKKPAQKATPGGVADEIKKSFHKENRAQGRRITDCPSVCRGREGYEYRRPLPNQRTSKVLIG